MAEVVHTYPPNDLIEHDLTGESCICGPEIHVYEDAHGIVVGKQIVHNSLDGREMREGWTVKAEKLWTWILWLICFYVAVYALLSILTHTVDL